MLAGEQVKPLSRLATDQKPERPCCGGSRDGDGQRPPRAEGPVGGGPAVALARRTTLRGIATAVHPPRTPARPRRLAAEVELRVLVCPSSPCPERTGGSIPAPVGCVRVREPDDSHHEDTASAPSCRSCPVHAARSRGPRLAGATRGERLGGRPRAQFRRVPHPAREGFLVPGHV